MAERRAPSNIARRASTEIPIPGNKVRAVSTVDAGYGSIMTNGPESYRQPNGWSVLRPTTVASPQLWETSDAETDCDLVTQRIVIRLLRRALTAFHAEAVAHCAPVGAELLADFARSD